MREALINPKYEEAAKKYNSVQFQCMVDYLGHLLVVYGSEELWKKHSPKLQEFVDKRKACLCLYRRTVPKIAYVKSNVVFLPEPLSLQFSFGNISVAQKKS